MKFRNLKRLAPVFMLLLFCALSVNTFAQKKTNEERAKQLTDKMKTELKLNDAQYQKVYTANLDFINKTSKAREEQQANRAEKMKTMKSYGDERDTALKGVLSEQQFTSYQEMKKERKEEMKEKMKKRG